MSKNHQHNKGNSKPISEGVERFAKTSFKKFKKNYAYSDDKKEIRKQYYDFLIDELPEAILFVVRYGHINDPKIQKAKIGVYKQIAEPGFAKKLNKILEHDTIDGLELMPIVLKDIMLSIKQKNDQILHENPNGQIYDITPLAELCKTLLKKKLKKMEKKGIDTMLAFDLLCIVPAKKAIEISKFYRIRSFYDCLYEHAKTKPIPVKEIMSVVAKNMEEAFLMFALLERREKFTKLNDRQKKVYSDISAWCFEELESYDASRIEDVIQVYINSRKRDDENGKDGPRRYALTAVAEGEYKKIAKTVQAISAKRPQFEKYLG